MTVRLKLLQKVLMLFAISIAEFAEILPLILSLTTLVLFSLWQPVQV